MSEHSAIMSMIYMAARALVWTVIAAAWWVTIVLAYDQEWWDYALRIICGSVAAWVAFRDMRTLRRVALIASGQA